MCTTPPELHENFDLADTQSIVLENLTYGFGRPSVLDAKLGTVLYDADASEEKKARMIKKAQETTTGKVGLRFTGCQVSARARSERSERSKRKGSVGVGIQRA